MHGFLRHVIIAANGKPIRVRKHPKHEPSPEVIELVDKTKSIAWDTTESLRTSLEQCRVAAMVNSSCGVEALGLGIPILCFGESIYRHEGAVYICNSDEEKTAGYLDELQTEISGIHRSKQIYLFSRIIHHQWWPEETTYRLDQMLRKLDNE